MRDEPAEIVIDDLPQHRAPRWELALGLMLALAVVAFAGFDWWQQDQLSSTYTAARAATARHDWESAAVLFAQLGDYRDAPTQHTLALAQIAERDSQYAAGVAASASTAWLSAAMAFSSTTAIQPGFRDAAAQYVNARDKLIDRDLQDIVYRKASGLYILRSGAEVQLPASDGDSRVWASDASHIVYDVPVPDQRVMARHLQVALLDDKSLQTVRLVAIADPKARIIFGKAGLWIATPLAVGRITPGVSGFVDDYVQYFSYVDGRAQTVNLPGPNWGVLAINGAGDKLLLGEFRGVVAPDVPSTRLYTSGPSGAEPRRVGLAAGVVRTASFSPYGSYVLYMAQQERGRGIEVHRATLAVIDLIASEPQEQVIASVVVAYGSEAVPVAGTFLPGGWEVLVKLSNGVTAAYSVRDLPKGTQTKIWEGPPVQPEKYWLDPVRPTLIFREAQADGYTFKSIDLFTADPPATLPAMPAEYAPVASVQLAKDYAVYTSSAPDGGNVIFGGRLDSSAAKMLLKAGPDQSLLLSDSLLAYIGGDSLRLQALDGTFAVEAQAGINAIWPIFRPAAVTWTPGE